MKAPLPNWQTRRAEILQQACQHIANTLQKGETLLRAIGKAKRKFKSRSLGKGRKICLSRSTMLRSWYSWKHRPTLSAFKLHYKPGRKVSIDANLLQTMFKVALDSGLNITEVYGRFGGFKTLPFSLNTLRRVLPRRLAELARQKKRVDQIKILVAQEGETITNKKEAAHAERKHIGISEKRRMRILVSKRKNRRNNPVYPAADRTRQKESCYAIGKKNAECNVLKLNLKQTKEKPSSGQVSGE